MTKRIKLKIHRHRLPTLDILWPLKAPPTHHAHDQPTIASLLSDINAAIPLESGDWTLDQYVCELDGYECLHYAFVSDILHDGDEVTIRPLTSPDVKARRLGGRTQITGEGFHILDGVPYGLGPHQRPARPGILIPSRKRRRPEMEEEDVDADAAITVAEVEEDEELLGHVNGGAGGGGFALQTVEEVGEEEDTRPRKKQKNVHFRIVKDIPDFTIEEAEDDGEDDEEDDEDFDPKGGAESASQDGDVSSAVESSGDASSSDVSSTSSEDDSDSGSDDDSSSSSSDSDTSNASEKPEVLSSKTPPTSNGIINAHIAKQDGIPNSGSPRTKKRNKRRQIRKRILSRVRAILGSKDATSLECDAWLEANPREGLYVTLAAKDALHEMADGEESGVEEEQNEEFTGCSEDVALSNGIHVDGAVNGVDDDETMPEPEQSSAAPKLIPRKVKESSTARTRKSTDFEQRRQNLLDAISAGGIVNSTSNEPTSITDAEAAAEAAEITPTPTTSKRDQTAPEDTNPTPDSTKRVRIDVNGSRRAIFGALGQRTPKTQQDADRVRAKLAGLGKSKTKSTSKTGESSLPEEALGEEDPYSEAWRDKILLGAVDCDDPSIQLSEPPYPFKQRWDVSQQRHQENWSKKRKRRARMSYGDGSWEGDEDEGYVELDYGDEYDFLPEGQEGGEEGEEEYADGEAEMAEMVEEQLLSEADVVAHTAAKHTKLDVDVDVEEDDDLPSLPADLTTLPALIIAHLTPGAVITFRQLEVSAATNWSPSLSAHKTALVTAASAGGRAHVITLRLAKRDRDVDVAKYDGEGRRVYEKFEMDRGGEEGDGDEEGEDDGVREVMFEDMVEARLVREADADGVLEGSLKGEGGVGGDDGGVVGAGVMEVEVGADAGACVAA